MKIVHSAPTITVKFTSVDGDDFVIEGEQFQGDILQLTTTKTFDDAAGSFSITMVARKKYDRYFKNVTQKTSLYEVFRPTSVVDIFINNKEIMIGIIDNVSPVNNWSTGKPVRSIVVSGRDLGAMLIDHKIWSDEKLIGGRKYNFSMMGSVFALGRVTGTPSNIIQELYNKWMVRVVNQTSPPTYQNDFRFSDGDSIERKLIGLEEGNDFFSVRGNPNTDEVKSFLNSEEAKNLTAEEVLKLKEQSFEGRLLSITSGTGALAKVIYGNYYPLLFTPYGYDGDLLNLMKTVTSSPFNELYVETGGTDIVLGNLRDGSGNEIANFNNKDNIAGITIDFGTPGKRVVRLPEGRAYIVMRPTPFDDTDLTVQPTNMESLLAMQDLISHQVDDSIIVSKQLVQSKNSIPSFYHVMPGTGLSKLGGGIHFVNPEYDEKALRRYGHNPLEVKLGAFDIHNKNFGLGGMRDLCTRFQKKLRSWYSISDRLLTGTVTIKGNENIRIGHRLDYIKTDNGKIEDEFEEGKYYINSVIQTYQYGGSFVTKCGLKRGLSKKLISALRK
jgi:hypothetical protein